jgi:hypothetical protein
MGHLSGLLGHLSGLLGPSLKEISINYKIINNWEHNFILVISKALFWDSIFLFWKSPKVYLLMLTSTNINKQ